MLTALLLAVVCMAAIPAHAQDSRGYYEAVVASADFTIDLQLEKTYFKKLPQYIVVRCSIDCTVQFSDSDGWTVVGSTATDITDEIHIWAGEPQIIEVKSRMLKITGANTGKLSILAVY